MSQINLNSFWCPTDDVLSDRGGPKKILFMPDHLPWLLEAEGPFVDLGCGSGGVVKHIRETGVDAQGITYQKGEIERGLARGVPGLVLGDVHDLPWGDETFGGALLWDVLEHTLAPLVVLKEAKRVLRPGGRLLIFIPGAKWIPARYHIIVPNVAQMKHLLALAGFNRVEISDYSESDPGMAVYKVTK